MRLGRHRAGRRPALWFAMALVLTATAVPATGGWRQPDEVEAVRAVFDAYKQARVRAEVWRHHVGS